MPQRFLRPGIRTSDAWNSVSFGAQSFYIRLLTLVDDFGRYDGRVPVLHGECFALRSDVKPQQTAGFRSELQDAGLIDVYLVDGKEFLQVLRWQERARSDKSKYPDPQDSAAERRIPQEKDASLVPRSSPSPLHPRQRANGLTSKPPAPTAEDLIAELGKDKTYEGLNVRREYGKMENWCRANSKTPSRKRFINWLNRVERPIERSFKAEKPLDPAKINVAHEFTEWAVATYPHKADEIRGWITWNQVPDVIRLEWKREKIDPLIRKVVG